MSYRHPNSGGHAALLDYEVTAADARPNGAAGSHKANYIAAPSPAVPKSIVVEYLFSIAASALAFLYAGAFLWSYFGADYFAPASSMPAASLSLGESPQTVILLCLIFAAAFLSLLRSAAGKALALATYLFTAWQFYAWLDLTGQVKANTGRDAFEGARWIGNKLYGGGVIDGLTGIVVIFFILLSAGLLVQNLVTFINARRQGVRVVPRPLVDRRVNGYRPRHY